MWIQLKSSWNDSLVDIRKNRNQREDIVIEFLVETLSSISLEEAQKKGRAIRCDFVHLSKSGLTFRIAGKIVHYRNRDKTKYRVRIFVKLKNFREPVNLLEVGEMAKKATEKEFDPISRKPITTEEEYKIVGWTLSETCGQLNKLRPENYKSYFSFESLDYRIEEIN